MHILGIYAEPSHAGLLTRALGATGFSGEVVSFSDIAEAAAYLGDCREGERVPDLVVLDFCLPRSASAQFLNWLRRQPELRRLPVFALRTDGLNVASGRQELAAGLDDSLLTQQLHTVLAANAE